MGPRQIINQCTLFRSVITKSPRCFDASCLSNGFSFELNYKGDRKRIYYKNMLSTDQFGNEIQTKVDKEIGGY